MFKLGQKIEITGRFEKLFRSRAEVDRQEESVKKGAVAFSRKYETVKFDEVKEGIIVGKRSVVGFRKHHLASDGFVHTITNRCTVYLVACDLRGMYMVPIECITPIIEAYEYDELDDFYFSALDELDFDDEYIM